MPLTRDEQSGKEPMFIVHILMKNKRRKIELFNGQLSAEWWIKENEEDISCAIIYEANRRILFY
jgi:hypothetical protein